MRRTIFVVAGLLPLFVSLFCVLVLRPVRTVKAQQGCSDATLRGNYGLRGFGYYSGSPATVTGLLTFNGSGGLSGSNIYIDEDGTSSGASSFNGATYHVNGNCTIAMNSFVLFDSENANGTVVDGGSEVITDLEGTKVNAVTLEIKKAQGGELGLPGPIGPE